VYPPGVSQRLEVGHVGNEKTGCRHFVWV
jgi:hypothetical protein